MKQCVESILVTKGNNQIWFICIWFNTKGIFIWSTVTYHFETFTSARIDILLSQIVFFVSGCFINMVLQGAIQCSEYENKKIKNKQIIFLFKNAWCWRRKLRAFLTERGLLFLSALRNDSYLTKDTQTWKLSRQIPENMLMLTFFLLNWIWNFICVRKKSGKWEAVSPLFKFLTPILKIEK